MRRIIGFLLVGLAFGVAILFFAPRSRAPQRAPAAEIPEFSEPPLKEDAPEIARSTVLDEAGQCVPGAKLTLYRVIFLGLLDAPDIRLVATVGADEAGHLLSALPAENDGLLVIEAKGYPVQARDYKPEEPDIRALRGTDETCTIVDDEGRPAAGAQIDVFADRSSKIRLGAAVADAQGRVTLRVAGVPWLLVRHAGHAYVQLHIDDLPESLTLQPEFTFGGRIVDSEGNPLSGALVRLKQGECYDMTLVAGSGGEFLFQGMHDEDGRLTAKLPGYGDASSDVRPGDEHVRVVIRRTASVSGMVATPDGLPVRDAEVELRYGDEVKTDAGGHFRLEGLAPTAHEIRAALGRELQGSVQVEPKEGEEITDLRIVLAPVPHSYVRVRVVEEGGDVVPDWRVSGDSAQLHFTLAQTDPSGVATLDFPDPPGTATEVSAFAPFNRSPPLCDAEVRAVTTATPDAEPVVDLMLHEPVLVRLDARAEDGTPLPDAWALFPGDVDSYSREKWLDPAAEHAFTVWAPGFLTRTVKGWRPRDNDNVLVVTLERAAAIRGRLAVEGEMPEEIRLTSDLGVRDVRCEPDGRFLVDEVREGRHTFSFGRRPGLSEARVEVEAVAGEVTDVGMVKLVPCVTLTGRVLDITGDPVGGARIERADDREDTYSRADGTFRIAASAFANGTLIVRRQGLGAIRSAVSPGPSRAIGDLVMPSPGAVQVEVEGLVSKETWVSLAWADEPAVRLDWFVPADGRPHRNDDLAPGRYVARLCVGDDLFKQEFAIAAGQTTNVTFHLKR